MGKKWKHSKSSMIRGVLVTVCAVLFFLGGRFESRAAGTGKIKVGSAIIRQSADTNSAPVATSSQGTVVTINSEVTDASGSVWYEIQVDANTIGYVRSDLVEKEGGSDTGAAEAAQNNAGFAPGAEIGPEETMEAQYATIKVRAAKSGRRRPQAKALWTLSRKDIRLSSAERQTAATNPDIILRLREWTERKNPVMYVPIW